MNAFRMILMVLSAVALVSCAGTATEVEPSSKATLDEQAQPPASTIATGEANEGAQPSIVEFSYESADGIESYADILAGRSLEPITLTSRLTLPARCSEPGHQVPAVIIQHGSTAPRQRWYRELPEALAHAGIAALVADSYAARGLMSTTRDQTLLSRANRVYDAFSAFRGLAALSCIDPDRIGITGYSFGGIVSRDVVESMLADRLGEGHVFKASLPVYPSCQGQWDVSQPTKTKVHFLLAELDDYTPAGYCIEQIPKLRASGWDVGYTVYPGTHHGFIADRFYGYNGNSWTFKHCGITRVTTEGYEVHDKFGIDMGKTMTWAQYIRKAAGCAVSAGSPRG